MLHKTLETNILDKMKKRGEIDARNDNDHTENYHKIKAEAEFLVQETIANCKGKINSLRKKLENILSKQNKINNDLNFLRT